MRATLHPQRDRHRPAPQPDHDRRHDHHDGGVARLPRHGRAVQPAGQRDEGLLVRQGRGVGLPLRADSQRRHGRQLRGRRGHARTSATRSGPTSTAMPAGREGLLRVQAAGLHALQGAVQELRHRRQRDRRPDAGVVPGQADQPGAVRRSSPARSSAGPASNRCRTRRRCWRSSSRCSTGCSGSPCGLALLMILVSVILIVNTIRVAAFSRRRETGIMKLVGASNFSIQLPFLLEGAISGFLGAAARDRRRSCCSRVCWSTSPGAQLPDHPVHHLGRRLAQLGRCLLDRRGAGRNRQLAGPAQVPSGLMQPSDQARLSRARAGDGVRSAEHGSSGSCRQLGADRSRRHGAPPRASVRFPRLLLTLARPRGAAASGPGHGRRLPTSTASEQVDRDRPSSRHDLDETSQRCVGAIHVAEPGRVPAARPAARSPRVHGQLAAAQARDRLLGDQLEVAKAEVAAAQRQIDATLARLGQTHKLIGRIARSSYQQGGMGELAVVLQSQSPDEFATRLVLVQNAMRSEGTVLSGLAEDRANLAAQRATLVAKRRAGRRDEAPAGGAGREDQGSRGAGRRRPARGRVADRRRASAVADDRAGEGSRGAPLRGDAGRVRAPGSGSWPRGPAARTAAASRCQGHGRWRPAATAAAAACCRTRRTAAASPRRTACGRTRSPASTSCTTAPTSASAAVRRCTRRAVGPGHPGNAVGGYGNQLVIDHGVMRGAVSPRATTT